VDGARRLDARIIEAGDDVEGALGEASRLSQENDWRLIHPYDDPEVIAGQGTVGLEMLDAQPDAVLAPIGGGGLAAGLALALQGQGVPLFGVQVEGVDAMAMALTGRRPSPPSPTLADGLRVREPGRLARLILAQHLDGMIRITEAELVQAMLDLARHEHLLVEGAGAASVAAMGRIPVRHAAAVVSGGNLDLPHLARLIEGEQAQRRHVGSVRSHLEAHFE